MSSASDYTASNHTRSREQAETTRAPQNKENVQATTRVQSRRCSSWPRKRGSSPPYALRPALERACALDGRNRWGLRHLARQQGRHVD
nr:MAG: MC063L [Molluscum contagiosum virus]